MAGPSPRPLEEATVSVEPSVRAAENVRRDEAALSLGHPAIRVAVLAGLSLSYGVAVAPSTDYVRQAQQRGLPAVRRTSGGTGLLHRPGDLVWSIVLPRSDPRVGRDAVHAYGRFGAGVVRWLAEHGLSAAWIPAPGLSEGYCTLSGRGQVLTVADRILGGAAQHLQRTALLHHGTISQSIDREEIGQLFGPPTAASASQLTSLHELGVVRNAADLARSLAGRIAEALADV